VRTAVIAPHLDDAVFSVGEQIIGRDDVVIICPFGGLPDDKAGKAKYLTLLAEHSEVCHDFGWNSHVGPFFDDVYERTRDISGLRNWLHMAMTDSGVEEVWVPMGIHHPDHRIVGRTAWGLVIQLHLDHLIYEELPYRVLYPDKVVRINELHYRPYNLQGYTPKLEQKRAACRAYASQINDDIERCLYVPERVWRPE
jgi:hypothetical protein